MGKLRNGWFLIALLTIPAGVSAEKPSWAKKGVGFAGSCRGGSCRPMRIVAPDKKSVVEVRYQDGAAYLRVTAPEEQAREIHDVSSGANDLLWAPDSKAFFIDTAEGATYGSLVQVYMMDDPDLRPLDVTQQAERDMVKSFPPCKALYLDPATCRKIAANPEYNMTAIDWGDDSSAIVVLAEVPCTSNFGGILCQSLGYELEVPSGKILKRMQPAEFKDKWQHSMAWRFQIPEPPQYQN